MLEFAKFKAFWVKTHPPKAPTITKVLWQPLISLWIKCNIDKAVKGFPGFAACGG